MIMHYPHVILFENFVVHDFIRLALLSYINMLFYAIVEPALCGIERAGTHWKEPVCVLYHALKVV